MSELLLSSWGLNFMEKALKSVTIKSKHFALTGDSK